MMTIFIFKYTSSRIMRNIYCQYTSSCILTINISDIHLLVYQKYTSCIREIFVFIIHLLI